MNRTKTNEASTTLCDNQPCNGVGYQWVSVKNGDKKKHNFLFYLDKYINVSKFRNEILNRFSI